MLAAREMYKTLQDRRIRVGSCPPDAKSCASLGAIFRGSALSSRDAIERRERRLLPAIRVKIRGIEPALKIRFARRPFGIEHGEPCRIPISAFDNHVLSENSLERKTKTQRGSTRGCIQGIALPLV